MKEAEIRADVGVSFTRQPEPEAQIKPAVVLTNAVAVSRSVGACVVPGEEGWGLYGYLALVGPGALRNSLCSDSIQFLDFTLELS